MAKSKFGLLNYTHPDAFGKWLGYRVIGVNAKKMTSLTSLKVRADHLSPSGRIHGGVVSSLFDIACVIAIFPTLDPRDFCSTVELKVNYFRPMDLGDTLTAKSQVMFRGKRLCVVHSLLYRKGLRQPVAMATATYNIVNGAELALRKGKVKIPKR